MLGNPGIPRGEYAHSDRWSFRDSGEFFFIVYNDIDESLADLYAGNPAGSSDVFGLPISFLLLLVCLIGLYARRLGGTDT